MAEHTKLPWRLAGKATIRSDDGYICTLEQSDRDANAAFIVKAVNCHDELVGAIDKIDSVMRRNLTCSNKLDKIAGILTDLDHLLAKAREV